MHYSKYISSYWKNKSKAICAENVKSFLTILRSRRIGQRTAPKIPHPEDTESLDRYTFGRGSKKQNKKLRGGGVQFLAALSSSWNLVVRPTVRRSVRQSVRRSVRRSVCRSVHRSVIFVKKWSLEYQMRVSEWWSDWVTEWLSEGVNQWMSEWVNQWMSNWVTEWLSVWVTEWLNDLNFVTEILWLNFCYSNVVTQIL